MASPLNIFVDYVRALIWENVTSLAIKTSLIFAGAMTILVAVSFCMFGAAQGLGKVLGVDLWLGFLITGTSFLLPILLLFVVVSYKTKKETLKKKAEQKKSVESLSRKIFDIVDVRWWVQKYPFYATGAAALTGFTLSGTKMLSSEMMQDSAVAMVLALAEDVLKGAVVPFVREQLKAEGGPDPQDVTQ